MDLKGRSWWKGPLPAANSFLNKGGFFANDCPLRKSDTAVYHFPIWPMQFSNSCPAATNFFTVLNAVVAAVTAVIGSSMLPSVPRECALLQVFINFGL